MKFPGRSQREEVSYDGSWGAQLEAPDTSRHGVVDDGLVAFPERIVEAERQWFHARAEDFEQVDTITSTLGITSVTCGTAHRIGDGRKPACK
jgi:hypothetical protein